MAKRKLAPIHPGEVLALDFLEPLAISRYRLAKDISVPVYQRDCAWYACGQC
jgi:antitoxin HigA-1